MYNTVPMEPQEDRRKEFLEKSRAEANSQATFVNSTEISRVREDYHEVGLGLRVGVGVGSGMELGTNSRCL